MSTSLPELNAWVDEVASHTKPDQIVWCDGSDEEYDRLVAQMLLNGDLSQLDNEAYPNCFLHRSDPQDVARVEHLTFVCCDEKEDAGPNNNWMSPEEGHAKIDGLFDDCMKGRTMYVVPYCMGPIDSPLARCGVEITDSPYVVINMRIMTRMGSAAQARIEREGSFVRGLHSIGELDPDRRYIMHFPEELTIKSYGSGYGGNALLGKKCHALRIASWQARDEGWLAEHMLIVGIQNPQGEVHYVCAAFPSACGKTNLAMLIPPESYDGWKIWTVGDDISWLHVGDDGRLWAINPEAGYFGVVPGTNHKTNRNAYDMIQANTIFTNVGVTEENHPWWEGKPDGAPHINWKGDLHAEDSAAAHPNSRFTVCASQNPVQSDRANDPRGVPISAIIFGGRRKELAPLVYEAKDWAHGVLMGASVASETTAAATGQVGIVRRDPMAMKPFCGYNFASYWDHWLSFEERANNLPKMFHVNWFRQDEAGRFMWPGFGENIRVLRWILDRCDGKGDAVESPIGYLPNEDAIDTAGLDINPEVMNKLTSIDPAQWHHEVADIREYLESYGARLPSRLTDELAKVKDALTEAS